MAVASTWDFAPLLRIMLVGLLLALLPLGWVWLRNRRARAAQRLRALTVLTLFLTLDLVLIGAFTRLTDSGLGCPDWPGCYGSASPSGAQHHIRAAEAAMPTGPVTWTKAWIEMLHRYAATGVGALIVLLATATWAHRRRGLPVSMAWPLLTLAGVCLQGAFGAFTVTMKLFPLIVTLHLLGGMALLALLTLQAVSYGLALDGASVARLPQRLRAFLWLCFVLLWLQIALGGWVSTNYAVLACSDFPACQGSWWPAMSAEGFTLWRELGHGADGAPIPFTALTAIHYVHRLFAFAVLAALGILAWRLRAGPLARHGRWIAGLALWQFGSGLSNVVLDWPMAAALAHTAGAAGLVVVLTAALRASRTVTRPAVAGTSPGRVIA